MRAGVNVLIGLLGWSAAVSAPLALVVPGSSRAEEEDVAERDGASRWVPSLSVISGVTIQDWEGTAVGIYTPDPDFIATLPTQAARDNAAAQGFVMEVDGEDRDVRPYVGGNLELMTPELPLPGSPRFFVGGELAAAFGTERAATREGDPTGLTSPIPEGSQDSTSFSEDATLGQGSEVVADVDNVIYGAYAGIAFPVELFGRQLRVKPSFGWIRYDIDVEGRFLKAECRNFTPTDFLGIQRGCSPNEQGFLRELSFAGAGSDTFDGIGPGLDVELDTGRLGPLGTSLFAGARVYRILGEREIAFETETESFDFVPDVSGFPAQETGSLPEATASGRYSFEVQRWAYRVGVGLRIHWLGWK